MRARYLYKTGSDMQQSYDASIIGSAPTQTDKARANAMAAMDTDGVQPCTTTTLSIKLGSRYDPMVAKPVSQVTLWTRILDTTKRHQDEVIKMKKAWKSAYVSIAIPTLTHIHNKDGYIVRHTNQHSPPTNIHHPLQSSPPKENSPTVQAFKMFLQSKQPCIRAVEGSQSSV